MNNVAKTMNCELFNACSNDLENHLVDKLELRSENGKPHTHSGAPVTNGKLIANEHLKDLLEVSQEVMEQRKDLENKKRKLAEGREELEVFLPLST